MLSQKVELCGHELFVFMYSEQSGRCVVESMHTCRLTFICILLQ